MNSFNYCSGNCPLKIKGLLWINNQSFWASQCLCCHTYQFESGKTCPEWGGIYG